MSVVKINAISVSDGRGPDLEKRFANRLQAVERMDGFEGFELLRPVKGETRYFVYTKWASEEAFQRWVSSAEFKNGHAQAARENKANPVATNSTLLSFEVVLP